MMHSGSLTEEPSKRQKSSEGQDIISSLSDCIIAHILSFLPTNYAVRTSALSQRWRYMWTFVTKLCFSDSLLRFSFPSEEAKNRYIDFVSRVLLLLNSATIQKFSLDISENLDSYYINLWISAISNRRVKNISVTVHSWIDFDLSAHPLFKCQSLEELVLQMTCQCNIKVPTFVSLSSLTVLDLYGITLTCYSSNESKELTLNLPVLRKYKTTCCIWFGVKSVTIEAPLLEVVSLNYNVLSPPKPNDYESRAEIKFCASHLTRFSYEGSIPPSDDIVLESDIASTSIGLYNLKETSVQETWIVLCKLLRINAKCLKLSLRVGWQYLSGTEHYLADIPVFGMLSDLLISSVTGFFLLGLLLKSPSLESLVFQLLDFDEEPHNFAIVPDCFLTTLKVVEFARFSGNDSELSFAKFVMENARVLERIIFSCSPELCGLELEKVKEKLFKVKKSSSMVIVEYESVPGGFRRYLSMEDI